MVQIYLDYNATTPLRPEAVEAMLGVLHEDFGNPSSPHWAGAAARDHVARARAQVASLLGVEPDTIVFTSGATEASNTVIRHAAARAPGNGDHIVTCATEHPAVLEVSEEMREQGLRVTVLPVERDGRLDPERFAASLTDRTLLASVMWVNNETGVIHPIPRLAASAHERGVPFHSDAVQALGKIPLDFTAVPVTYASFSAHKLGGPKGVGALYASTRFSPLLRGGPQERRRRPGTENVPGIVGFGAACAAAERDLQAGSPRLRSLRDRLWEGLAAKIPDSHVNGSREHRVPHTLSVSFERADGEALVAALDIEGIAVASGAACASGSPEPSHVLSAMGIPPAIGSGAIRISLGFASSDADIDRLLDVLPDLVQRVREASTPHGSGGVGSG